MNDEESKSIQKESIFGNTLHGYFRIFNSFGSGYTIGRTCVVNIAYPNGEIKTYEGHWENKWWKDEADEFEENTFFISREIEWRKDGRSGEEKLPAS